MRALIATLTSLGFAQVAHADAQTVPTGVTSVQSLAAIIVNIINAAVILLIVVAIVIYFYGAVQKLVKMRNGKVDGDFTKFFLTGIGIIFVMVSIWGIIHLVQSSLFGSQNQGSGLYQSGT